MVAPAVACLNCGALRAGIYCAACGQQALDPTAPTWHVLREALADATDLDGRVLRTLRAAASPGRLTVEFLRGRRAPYLGPVKLFLLAGAALSTTWVLTRGVNARFYGYKPDSSAAAYIDTVVRGSLAAGLAVAASSWVLAGGRRRLLDEAVFALHVVAALSLLAAAVIWLAAAWKLAWGAVARVPRGVPPLPYLLFDPAAAVGLGRRPPSAWPTSSAPSAAPTAARGGPWCCAAPYSRPSGLQPSSGSCSPGPSSHAAQRDVAAVGYAGTPRCGPRHYLASAAARAHNPQLNWGVRHSGRF